MEPVEFNRKNIWYRFATQSVVSKLYNRTFPRSTCGLFSDVIFVGFATALGVFALTSCMLSICAYIDLFFFEGATFFEFVREASYNTFWDSFRDFFWSMWVFSGFSIVSLVIMFSVLIGGIMCAVVSLGLLFTGIGWLLQPFKGPATKVADPLARLAYDWWNKICRPIKIVD